MKLVHRKSGTCDIIGMTPGDVRVLADALEALELHHWSVARAMAEGSPLERGERDRARMAERLARRLDDLAEGYSIELANGSPCPDENYVEVRHGEA